MFSSCSVMVCSVSSWTVSFSFSTKSTLGVISSFGCLVPPAISDVSSCWVSVDNSNVFSSLFSELLFEVDGSFAVLSKVDEVVLWTESLIFSRVDSLFSLAILPSLCPLFVVRRWSLSTFISTFPGKSFMCMVFCSLPLFCLSTISCSCERFIELEIIGTRGWMSTWQIIWASVQNFETYRNKYKMINRKVTEEGWFNHVPNRQI
jgi:hypothetical protein